MELLSYVGIVFVSCMYPRGTRLLHFAVRTSLSTSHGTSLQRLVQPKYSTRFRSTVFGNQALEMVFYLDELHAILVYHYWLPYLS